MNSFILALTISFGLVSSPAFAISGFEKSQDDGDGPVAAGRSSDVDAANNQGCKTCQTPHPATHDRARDAHYVDAVVSGKDIPKSMGDDTAI